MANDERDDRDAGSGAVLLQSARPIRPPGRQGRRRSEVKSINIVFSGKQQAELRGEPVPELPPDGVLVRTRASLISSGTETICYRGESDPGSHWHSWVRYPFYPGYSNVGAIERTGSEVSGFAPGERVFTTASHHQFAVARGAPVKIPDAVSDESAAWSKLATIAQTGVRRAGLAMGAAVAIIGLGPLGQLLSQYVRVMGAEQVIAIDPLASRLQVALAHGATHQFAGSAGDALPFVEELTGGVRADVVFDATGHPPVLPLALALARRFGLVMLIGDAPNPSRQVLTSDVITRQISIRGTHNENLPGDQAQWSPARQIELFYTYLMRGQMRVDDLITARHAPADAPQVYARLLNDRGASLGVLFDWSRL